ncbi:MAG: amino acid kinase family protein [Candidatus Ranarchaeia archaeon]|jgi:aspartate kinase
MKLGGSLIDFKGTLFPDFVKIIEEQRKQDGIGPVVVVSAPNGCTDKLLLMGQARAQGEDVEVEQIFNQYRELTKHVVSEDKLDGIFEELEYFEKRANNVLSVINKRFEGTNKAQLLTVGGELPFAAILDYVLRSRGVNSKHLPLSGWPIITDDNFENALPNPEASKEAGKTLIEHLERGLVVTQAGFLGMTHDGLETLLGRGGSDQSAVIDAFVLNEKYDVKIHLYKSTPILSSNPNVVTDQELYDVPTLTYNEALKATTMGTKIVQKAAVSLAQQFRFSIDVIPIHEPQRATVITDSDSSTTVVKIVSGLKSGVIITLDDRMSKSLEDCLRRWENYSEFLDLGTETLASGKVIRDIFILDNDFVKKHESQIKQFDPKMTIRYGLGVVTLVGDSMRHTGGVAATAMSTIPRTNINRAVFAPHTSQIIFIVADKDVEHVMKSIHGIIAEVNQRGPGNEV